MEISHFDVIGAVIGAMVAAALPAYQAARRAGRVDKQTKPNGSGEETIRSLIVEILHRQNVLDERFDSHLEASRSDMRRED